MRRSQSLGEPCPHQPSAALTLLTGDIGLIIVFLQNQLVSYADGSSGHDGRGRARLDPRERKKNRTAVRREQQAQLL